MKTSGSIKSLTFQSSFMTSEKCCTWFWNWTEAAMSPLKCFASNKDRPMILFKTNCPSIEAISLNVIDLLTYLFHLILL